MHAFVKLATFFVLIFFFGLPDNGVTYPASLALPFFFFGLPGGLTMAQQHRLPLSTSFFFL
jgi:hypothetical protein